MKYVIQNEEGLFYTGNALSLWGASHDGALGFDREADANDVAEAYEMRNGKPLGALRVVQVGGEL